VALAYAGYAFFSSSTTNVVDALTLQRVAEKGESFGRIRLFGSAGFVVSSVAFGLSVSDVDRRTVLVAIAFMFLAAGWSFTIRARSATVSGRRIADGLALLGRRAVALPLLCTCLHWIACAPYHGTFALHVAALGLSPAVVGLGAGLGVFAEILVMWLHPSTKLGARQLLFLAFVASAVRWWAMSFAESAAAIVALCLLHGFTFGAFYVGAVGAINERVPPTSRASGQALFVSITFGIGGLVGYFAAGAAYDWLGGARLFSVAGIIELVAAALILLDRRR
jgi:PPP family 3-phenylpropionic acid transporter